MKQIANMLDYAMKRMNIVHEMSATGVVMAANAWLMQSLPDGRKDNARAISFRNGILAIECTNAGVAAMVSDHGDAIREFVAENEPKSQINKIRTRLVSSIQIHEF